VRSQTNPSVGFRFGFTGRELDSETGNYYYNSRYYDPLVGRFISEDTVGFGGGDANLYRYVGNSPTNYTDPSGQLIPTAIPVAAPPGAGLIPFLRGLGGAGILLAPPGGGGLLNPLPAGEDDQLFQDRVRRGLIRPQGTQTTPPLNRPKARPQPSTAPSTSPASPPLPNPDCETKTCEKDPELKKYIKCEEISKKTKGILVSYKYNSLEDAKKDLRISRRGKGTNRWWQAAEVVEGGKSPRSTVCKYPNSKEDPEEGALHYNVLTDDGIRNNDRSTSVGSLGRCECCENTTAGPLKRVRFAILNIKDLNGKPIDRF
jgi:RHS repeat-associated protein